jgi:hypothetical protein
VAQAEKWNTNENTSAVAVFSTSNPSEGFSLRSAEINDHQGRRIARTIIATTTTAATAASSPIATASALPDATITDAITSQIGWHCRISSSQRR